MLIEDKKVFSEEYTISQQETGVEATDTQQEKPFDLKIDTTYYKISKPRREIIRGKTINEKI